jgi:hypothetical protein
MERRPRLTNYHQLKNMNGVLVLALLATASTASAFSPGFSPAGNAHPRSAVTAMHASAPFQIPQLRPAKRAEVQDKPGKILE